MIIDYSSNGIPISDFEVEQFLLDNYNKNKDICISTENVIYCVRAFIVNKKIDKNNINLLFNGNNEDLILSEDGKILNHISGFSDFSERMLDIMLGI